MPPEKFSFSWFDSYFYEKTFFFVTQKSLQICVSKNGSGLITDILAAFLEFLIRCKFFRSEQDFQGFYDGSKCTEFQINLCSMIARYSQLSTRGSRVPDQEN